LRDERELLLVPQSEHDFERPLLMIRACVPWLCAGVLMGALGSCPISPAQQAVRLDTGAQFQLHQMMQDARDEVRKHYYDPKFHGVDWEARYREYDARINNAATLGDGFRLVAAFLDGLKDSHTFFDPPMRAERFDPGYRLGVVGDRCFVTGVRPGTDAESKVHVGDELVHLNGFDVNRGDFHAEEYLFRILAPKPAVQMDLLSPGGDGRTVTVNAYMRPTRKVMDLTTGMDLWDLFRREENEDHILRERTAEASDVAIWKMPDFFVDEAGVKKNMDLARRHGALILDLRGNPGGAEQTLEWMVGSLFNHDVKIGDRVARKESKPLIAKPLGSPFTGKLIVLVDGQSGSAAELLARVVQLEHRGTVIGDRTAGAVMEARYYGDSLGADTKIFYGFSVTEADLIMTDGKSLEKTGVVPDEEVLPTGADLAAGRDPVLAHAATLAGANLDPVAAGKLFPFEWMPL
jgi:carboxyl-terminal processing protease